MDLYVNGKKTTVDEQFKEILDKEFLKGACKTSDNKLVKDKEGNVYKIRFSIETIAWTKNEAERKYFTAKRELEDLTKSKKELCK